LMKNKIQSICISEFNNNVKDFLKPEHCFKFVKILITTLVKKKAKWQGDFTITLDTNYCGL
jgi:hypothetical protein